jgi:4-amino-4-deoxy-L-arabinose transferase-like glycosyltransferase
VAGLLGLVALLLLHVWWLVRIRSNAFREYDEAGYLSIALRNSQAYEDGGLLAGLRAALSETLEAPLAPALAVPALHVAGDRTGAAWSVQLLALAVLGLAAYGVARRCCAGWWPLLAAGVVVTTPLVIDYARLFHFALPAAALLMSATWAVLRSDALLRWRWAVLAGLLLGLAALTRTMMLAYLPGLGSAALLLALATATDRRRRLLGWVWMVLTTALTASVWYVPHARAVGGYLLASGYGRRSAEFGSGPPFSRGALLQAVRTVLDDVRVPLAVALSLAALAGVVAHVAKPLAGRSLSSAPATTLVLVVCEGMLAMSSSGNQGTAFALPWLPHLVVLVVAGLPAVARPLRRVLAVLLAVAALGALLVSSAVLPGLRPVRVDLPGVGEVRVLDPRGVVHEEAGALGDTSNGGPLPAAVAEVAAFTDEVAAEVVTQADAKGDALRLLDAAGDPLLNSTRYALSVREQAHRELVVASFHPRDTDGSVQQLAQEIETLRMPFLMTGQPGRSVSFGIVQARVERAAQLAGYRVVRHFRAYDGRVYSLWQRSR